MSKKRFTKEEQIIAEIDRAHAKHRELLEQAVFDEINGYPEFAKAKRRTADNIIEGRIKKLSVRLAEFRTMILPGVVPDNSMPVKLK